MPSPTRTASTIREPHAPARVQFDAAGSMRIDGSDPLDDLVGNRFVDDGPSDVVLFGLPYDGAVIGRKGARLGPAAIRAQLRKLKSDRPARWRDLGDAPVGASSSSQAADRDAPVGASSSSQAADSDAPVGASSSSQATHSDAHMPGTVAAGEVAREAMRAALATGAFPVALGGDHSLTYGLVRGVVDTLGEVSVLNLDAHLDVRIASPPNSGTSFRRLVEDKVVDPRRLAEIGIRPFANSPKYLAWANEMGIRVVMADRIEDWKAALDAIDGPLYVSLDIDVLDETAAPGVSAPTPGGLTTAQLFSIMRALAVKDIVALDVVETCPPLDVDDRTARAAACAILSLLRSRRPSPR